ncbi:hypothetical protein HNP21_005792 [Bacillus aryabhattai]|uniref:Uncharacterized protein n=1 Tax=Priestia aryabhattai TaxID=412384 RepID=A0A7W3NGR4_PRIAR|nr:hypothetical protein [Priestia aryabhattai]
MVGKDSLRGPLYRLYSFLYTLDMKGFLRGIDKERMYKKAVFYTYARTENIVYIEKICYYLSTVIELP